MKYICAEDFMLLLKIYNPDNKPVTVEAIKALLDKLPIDTERQGRWEPTGKHNPASFIGEYACTYCGKTSEGIKDYCPNCGAKMSKEKRV